RAQCPLDFETNRCGTLQFLCHELRIDVYRVLAGCTETERNVALSLMEHTPSEASRLKGLSRSTIYERIRGLRARFAAAGFGRSYRRKPCAARTKEQGTESIDVLFESSPTAPSSRPTCT